MLCLPEKGSCMILAMPSCRPFYLDITVFLLERFCSSFFAGQRRTAEKAAAGSGEEREGLGMEVEGKMFQIS